MIGAFGAGKFLEYFTHHNLYYGICNLVLSISGIIIGGFDLSYNMLMAIMFVLGLSGGFCDVNANSIVSGLN